MSKLFLFSLTEIFNQTSLDLIVLFANLFIVLASLFCIVLIIVKRGYGVLKRLWIVFFMVGITLVQLWLELLLNGKIKHLFLTLGISICTLSIILFLPKRTIKITQPQRDLARLISNSVKRQEEQNVINELPKESEVFCSPIIKAESQKIPVNNKKEIDFSHVKSVLNKLEYYPLKEQDKKQAEQLEKAIFTAEQNGMTPVLKEDINDGLGALLKIMSKYAV